MSNGEGVGGVPIVSGPVPGVSWNDLFRNRRKQESDKANRQRAAAIMAGVASETSALSGAAQRLPSRLPVQRIPSLGIAPGERVYQGGGIIGSPPQAPTGSLPPQWTFLLLLIRWFSEIFRRNTRQRKAATQAAYPGQWFPGMGLPSSTGGMMANFPSTLFGDFTGSGPGLDLGDIYGPNSWACRNLGIGCGSGGEGGGFPQIQGFPTLPAIPAPQFSNVVGGSSVVNGGACGGSPFRSGGSMAARAVPFFLPNPVTGRCVWFLPAGRPVLWSADLSAVRRVRKLASRAASRLGTRRRRRGGR